MRSLQVKFSVLVVSLLATACIGLAWIATQHERSALEAEIETRGRGLAEHLAGVAKEPLLAEDDLTLESLIKQVGSEWGVAAVRLVGSEGQVIATLTPSEVGERMPLLVGEGVLDEPASERVGRRRLRVAAPISYTGVRVGEAQLELDLAALVDPVVSESARQLALVAAAVMGLGVLAGIVFVAFLVEPLRRLRAGVERMAAGDLSVRVPPTSNDEVGSLTSAFNAMGESLQQKERIQREFGRYVSDYVLEQLLRTPEGDELRGAEREVTVLFADLRRFTRLSEGMKAREVVALLNEFFQLASDRVLASGGTIDKFIGDSLMAYFGAPVHQADHAERAVAAAMEIQRAVAERNARPGEGPGAGVSIQVGIGVHTGLAVVGSIGSARRADFTAIGDVVNVAHRLEKLALPGQILVSEAVQRRVRGTIRLRFEGERQLAGRQEPVHVYAVEPASSGSPERA